ncbi:MAG: hypothetical protein WC649_06425 [Desulfobacteria bacterium]
MGRRKYRISVACPHSFLLITCNDFGGICYTENYELNNLYNEALKSVQAGSNLPKKKIYVCEVCGNTVYDQAPEKCPVCSASRAKFKEIN